MTASEARAVQLVGGAIAAFGGVVALASLFVNWYSHGAICGVVPCRPATRSGWSALGPARYLVLAAALAGAGPLLAELLPRTSRALLRGGCALLALGAALLVVYRGAVPPGFTGQIPLGSSGQALLAGPFICFVACAGVAGGALLAGLGPRFFASAPGPLAAATALWAACLVVIGSLWLPWIRPQLILTAAGPLGTATAWEALHTLSVLLLLGALAVSGGTLIGAVFRWRAVFLAQGLAGWMLAAFAVAGTPLSHGLRAGGVQYHVGYYVCLAAAAVIVVTGISAALAWADEDRPL